MYECIVADVYEIDLGKYVLMSSLQCYRILSDILVKIELCIPLERKSNVLSTGNDLLPVSFNLLCFSVLSTKSPFRSVL